MAGEEILIGKEDDFHPEEDLDYLKQAVSKQLVTGSVREQKELGGVGGVQLETKYYFQKKTDEEIRQILSTDLNIDVSIANELDKQFLEAATSIIGKIRDDIQEALESEMDPKLRLAKLKGFVEIETAALEDFRNADDLRKQQYIADKMLLGMDSGDRAAFQKLAQNPASVKKMGDILKSSTRYDRIDIPVKQGGPNFRDEVDAVKLAFMGQSPDAEKLPVEDLQNYYLLGRVASSGQLPNTPQEQQQLKQIVRNILEGEGVKYNRTLQEKIRNLGSEKPPKVERSKIDSLKQEGVHISLALVELAEYVDEQMSDKNQKEWSDLNDQTHKGEGVAVHNLEQYDNIDFSKTNSLIGKVSSYEGMLAMLILKYGSIAMIGLNAMASIQQRDFNNPYLFGGFLGLYGAIKGFEGDWIKRLTHPERKTFYDVVQTFDTEEIPRSIQTEALDILDGTNRNEHTALEHLDFTKGGKRTFDALMKKKGNADRALEKQKAATKKAERKYEGEEPVSEHTEGWFDHKEWQITPEELKQLTRDPTVDGSKIDKLHLSSDSKANYARYQVLRMMYDNEIGSKDLPFIQSFVPRFRKENLNK